MKISRNLCAVCHVVFSNSFYKNELFQSIPKFWNYFKISVLVTNIHDVLENTLDGIKLMGSLQAPTEK